MRDPRGRARVSSASPSRWCSRMRSRRDRLEQAARTRAWRNASQPGVSIASTSRRSAAHRRAPRSASAGRRRLAAATMAGSNSSPATPPCAAAAGSRGSCASRSRTRSSMRDGRRRRRSGVPKLAREQRVAPGIAPDARGGPFVAALQPCERGDVVDGERVELEEATRSPAPHRAPRWSDHHEQRHGACRSTPGARSARSQPGRPTACRRGSAARPAFPRSRATRDRAPRQVELVEIRAYRSVRRRRGARPRARAGSGRRRAGRASAVVSGVEAAEVAVDRLEERPVRDGEPVVGPTVD